MEMEVIKTQKIEPGSMINVEQSRAIAEVQAAIMMAKRFPRDSIAALDRIVNSCSRPTLAEGALYEYSRGGTDITGPSIRLAEVIAQNWGNLICGITEVSRRDGESDCMAYAWDLESNFRDEKHFTVKHLRDTKKGTYKVDSERDIYEIMANMGARRKRACILAVIPGDVTETAVNQINTTLNTKAKVTPERLSSLLGKFLAYGVTKAQIEAKIQRHIDAMTPAQLINLGKIYNSLKDGMSQPGDWFEMKAPESSASTEDLTKKIKSQGKATKSESSLPQSVQCPNSNTSVEIKECEECKSREGCPAHD